jgi:ABC-type antimicrobial peptide transport system permease subunit
MRETLFLVAIGVAIGIPAALSGDRLVANMLFGVKSTDPASLLIAVALLLTVAVFAGYVPARRASRVDPMEVYATNNQHRLVLLNGRSVAG